MLAELEFGPFALEEPGSLLALLIGFLLLLAFIYSVIVPMFRKMLIDRTTRIAEAHAQVELAMADIQQLRNDYASRLQRIETEARELIESALREAEAAQGEIIADARQMASAVRQRTEEEVEREQQRARILLRRQIIEIAMNAAESAARSQSGSVQQQLIDDFIQRAAVLAPASSERTRNG